MNSKVLILFALFPLFFSNYFSFSDQVLSFLVYVSFTLVPLIFIYYNLKSSSIIDLSFWIYILVFIGYPFFFQLNNLNFPWLDYSIDNKYIYQGIFIFILGIFAFLAGRYSLKKRVLLSNRDLSYKNFDFLVMFSFFSMLYIVSQVGITSLVLPRVFYSQQIFGTNNLLLPLFSNLLEVLLPVCLIISLNLFKVGKISFKRLIITLVITLLFVNPIRSSRLEFFLLLLIIFLYLIRFNPFLWATSLIIGLAIIFPTADIFRSFEINNNNAALFDFNKSFVSGDFDSPAGTLIAILYIKSNSFFLGSNYLGALFSYIPRSIWESKPFGTGYTVSNGIGLEYPNIGINMWAEAYLSFGYIGVILFFFFFGRAISYLKNSFKKDYFSYIIYVYMSCTMIFILRGEVFQVGLRMVPLILIAFFITYKSKKSISFESP